MESNSRDFTSSIKYTNSLYHSFFTLVPKVYHSRILQDRRKKKGGNRLPGVLELSRFGSLINLRLVLGVVDRDIRLRLYDENPKQKKPVTDDGKIRGRTDPLVFRFAVIQTEGERRNERTETSPDPLLRGTGETRFRCAARLSGRRQVGV